MPAVRMYPTVRARGGGSSKQELSSFAIFCFVCFGVFCLCEQQFLLFFIS